jgi:hypothetical protein
MTTQANNKVTTSKQVTNKVIKTVTTPRKPNAVKTGYQINYTPFVINASDVLKTGLYALPVYGTIKPRNTEPLTLGHFVDRVKTKVRKISSFAKHAKVYTPDKKPGEQTITTRIFIDCTRLNKLGLFTGDKTIDKKLFVANTSLIDVCTNSISAGFYIWHRLGRPVYNEA